MTYFADQSEVYEYIGELFRELAADEELAMKFRAADTVVRYEYRKPDAVMTVKMLADQPLEVVLGGSDLEPEIEMSMDADVAHRFWLGKVNVTIAMARGQIKARGPVSKILKLVPLAKPAFGRYRELLEREDREDLLNV